MGLSLDAHIGVWLNAVEGFFFSAITWRRIWRGVFKSVAGLADAIKRDIADHNR